MNTPAQLQTAIFAAGCFWGVEETFRTLPGVIDTEVGYTGGHKDKPTYQDVCSHGTGHAEAVKIIFDPEKVSYQKLLEIFWKSHNPTTLNRDGPNIGDQYRSAIFYTNEEQKQEAEKSKAEMQKSGRWKNPIVTEIVAATPFYRAEEYHQKYLMNRGLGSCHL